MFCEYCNIEHPGTYGSGRFCCKKCACAFSTKNKRAEINAKVSAKLAGRKSPGQGFKKGHDPRRKPWTVEDRVKAVRARRDKTVDLVDNAEWNSLTLEFKRRRILKEQNNVCAKCGLNEWLGQRLVLELHHVNGKKDESREGLVCLCPNCHSQTDNWKK